ncbi:voltage-gated sodium channel [Thermocatellispora tengchongensis]|uniref:Voltage-gated sodium channel n=1 Tax=Thermocatellispora tengchongensis TaxID=1073253 RepID=A0A840P654_9ACTN|nr:ion transporter [Thermocatellispora tengchongensis]MBB5131485.1 voltage-gated sodium channel [Thermocatellispora tengchongensis]
MRAILETRSFERAIVTVIVVNAITIGCETSAFLVEHAGGLLQAIDRIAVTIFAGELAARLYVYRGSFFRDPWNWADLTIVLVALVPAGGSASVLRTLRVLRALRLISTVPSMRRVVSGLLAAVPGMASIIGLLLLVMYVSAVMATEMFGPVAPAYFADLPTSLFTLFQIMTGESWPDIVQQVMSARPWAWIFFVGYILVSSFVVLNLFIAVVVNAMDDENTSEEEQRTDDRLIAIMDEIARLHAKLDSLQAAAPATRNGVPAVARRGGASGG